VYTTEKGSLYIDILLNVLNSIFLLNVIDVV